jgi:uncharacterized membrane protein YgdD (TMEM256/DUF423 family)
MRLWGAIVLALSGLMGAVGVALAAVGAHLSGGALVPLAASFLLFHAAAGAGITAHGPRAGRRGAALLVGASALVLGAALFAADLVVRQTSGGLFLWGTAPTGGTIAILGWLAVALAALLPATPRGRRP